jgi:hypothetical protein
MGKSQYREAWAQIKRVDGMRRVFGEISEERNDFDVVQPWKLYQTAKSPEGIARLFGSKIINLFSEESSD